MSAGIRNQIRDARLRAGIDAKVLSRKIGRGKNYIYRIENGEIDPGTDELRDICDSLGLCFYESMLSMGRIPMDLAEHIVGTPGVLKKLMRDIAA